MHPHAGTPGLVMSTRGTINQVWGAESSVLTRRLLLHHIQQTPHLPWNRKAGSRQPLEDWVTRGVRLLLGRGRDSQSWTGPWEEST